MIDPPTANAAEMDIAAEPTREQLRVVILVYIRALVPLIFLMILRWLRRLPLWVGAGLPGEFSGLCVGLGALVYLWLGGG